MPSHPSAAQHLSNPSKGASMSNLVAIAYPDQATAEEVMGDAGPPPDRARDRARGRGRRDPRRQDGKVKLHQSNKLAAAGAAGGALWGGLIGLIFFVPLLGMAVGAATGAATGALTDVGVDDDFMKDLGTSSSRAAPRVIVLVHRSTPDKVLPEIAQVRRRRDPDLAGQRGRAASAPHPRSARRRGGLSRDRGGRAAPSPDAHDSPAATANPSTVTSPRRGPPCASPPGSSSRRA